MSKLIAVCAVLEDERNPEIAIVDLADHNLPDATRQAIEGGLADSDSLGGQISYDDWHATPASFPDFPTIIHGFVMIWVG